MLLLPMLYFLIFNYIPMYGIIIAFKNFIPSLGVFHSPWIGLENFIIFFRSYKFWELIQNTVGISIYSLVVGFPIPIILSLLLNELKSEKYKKTIQTVIYAPHFISTIVMAGMIIAFLSPTSGIINLLIGKFGIKEIPFLQIPQYFKSIFVFSGLWQSAGWSCIIYIATLAGIDSNQHEAAMVEGATKLQRIFYINIPHILPTAIIMLILSMGSIMNVGFEKIFLLQNPLNMETSDVISTYVYRMGLVQAQYGFAAAVGLFNSIINFILLVAVNQIAKRLNSTSLW